MRPARRTFLWIGAVPLAGFHTMAQTPFPDHVVQNVTWNSGTHHVAVAQALRAPGDPSAPVTIAGAADAELVSATQVRLMDGFHAGAFNGQGRFRATIDDAVGPAGDLVLIAPDPATHVTGGVLHVPKWEKLELGLQLPEVYRDAINGFYTRYYSDGPDQPVTPNLLDRAHDLNPYADDSLILVLSLVDPSGDPRIKWGFYMKEGRWVDPNDPLSVREESSGGPLDLYNVRYRFAPDEEGIWQFAISIRAPHTLSTNNDPLPDLQFTDYSFVCTPPLPDNHGYLEVNTANRRVLRFQDGTPFFGMGVNMADIRRLQGTLEDALDGTPYHEGYFFKRDHDVLLQSMEQLASVGGNYLRVWLMKNSFAPEWVNPGVYDRFLEPRPCADVLNGPGRTRVGSGQWQAWSFDEVVDRARQFGLYLQLCIDPQSPMIAYEVPGWGTHPYIRQFVEPSSPTRPYDLKEFFYSGGDPANQGDGTVFYYWKRKYKYLLARWGYSVNLAVLEPGNEVDQMLRYRHLNINLQDVSSTQYYSMCVENRIEWPEDPDLPAVLSQWFTDIADFVREPVDMIDPAHSNLGDTRQLFLASFGGSVPPKDPNTQQWNTAYYLPFTNADVDLIDAHRYPGNILGLEGQPDAFMESTFDRTQLFRQGFPSLFPVVDRKPFNMGEFSHLTEMTLGSEKWLLEGLFHNYDVSFHNELWTSAFSGNFATGLSWNWDRVFWWPDAQEPGPEETWDFQWNQWNPGGFSAAQGYINVLDVSDNPVPVRNKPIHHHFLPLRDLLQHNSGVPAALLSDSYTANKVISPGGDIETYYLTDAANSTVIGWVHNRHAWLMNSYYLSSVKHNMLGCEPPSTQSITISNLAPGTDYYITWFPTHTNTVIAPTYAVDGSQTGAVTLDLSTAPLGGHVNNYIDTLHTDYAFIITPEPFVKSGDAHVEPEAAVIEEPWDIAIYPNPATDIVQVESVDDLLVEISVLDLTGRVITTRSQLNAARVQLDVNGLAKGPYWIRVSQGSESRTKKLILN